ncbi:MAG: hypothetical protein IIC51_09630, partial [Planctomycetes bacterium]|nr:hypothetical protein [Planctomycetota bacterium]
VRQADATAPPPPSPPAIPRSLTLEGRLTIHLDDDESAPLMTFPVSCVRAGEVSISADLGPAEAKLNEIIVARQRTAQASVIQHLEERLTDAAVRCKLTPLVKRIKTPVEEVGFLLKPKGGEKVTVTANWNRDRFLFELGEQAEAELKAVLNGSAADTGPATAQTDSAKAVTTSNKKRPAVAVVGVGVVILAMAGAGYMFWPRAGGGSGGGQLVDTTTVSSTNDHTADNGPAPVVDSNTDDTTVDPNPNDNAAAPAVKTVSATEAIEVIKEALANSAYLQDDTSEFVDHEAGFDNGVVTLGYRVPGLQPVDRQVRLVASADAWSLDIDGVQSVVQSQQALTSLLDADRSDQFRAVVREVLDRKFSQFVTPAAVSVAGATPSWELDESRTFWVAQAETATITISNSEPATVAGLNFTARAGIVSLMLNGDLDQSIESALNGAIAAIQGNAVDAWLSGLDGIELPQDAVEYPEIGTDPRTQIQIRFSAPNLRPREYSAKWIPASLTFERQEWKLSALPFALALAVINALNDEDQRPDWIRQIPSIGVFREGDQSTANELHVVTAAPWADDADDLPEQLALRIPLDSTDTDIPMPRSWPLVVRYLDLIDHPMIVGPADPAIPSSTLWTELPEELTPLVNARLAAIQLDAAFQGKPRLIDDDLPQLDTQIVLSWRRSRSYEDMSAHAVTAGLDVLTGEKALLYKLSLRLDEQGDVTMKWEGYADNEDGVSQLDAIKGYDRLLREYSDRLLLEAKLARLLSSGSFVPLERDQAVQFLIDIWNIKAPEAAPAAPQDLASLTNTIRRQRGFSKKGRAREHDSPKPTIFGEYFCGPQSTFAIVWSTTETNSFVEGPTLVQLAATSDLITGADVGALLLDPVFDRVPEAVEPALPKNFKDAVGIILALDAPLELLAKDPADLKLHMRNSVLRECDPIKRAASAPVPWDSLRVLREESPTKRSDFKFVRSLIPPNETWQRETDPDLIEAAFRCRAGPR